MKISILLIFVLLACGNVYAAGDTLVVKNKWCARADTPLLFMGANNLIQVYGKNIGTQGLKLKSLDKNLKISNTEIKGDTLSTLAMPYAAGRKMRLAVVNKNGKTVKEVNMYGDKLPVLAARIGDLRKDTAAKNEILRQSALRAVFPKSLYSYPYRIIQYNFKTHYKNTSISLHVNSFFLTADVLAEISKVPPNTIIEFTDIKATCPDCESRFVDDLKILVK